MAYNFISNEEIEKYIKDFEYTLIECENLGRRNMIMKDIDGYMYKQSFF